MKSNLSIHNTLTRKKEAFVPLKAPFVGLYVCGPTVYGDPHLGHARPAITFDLLFRYLRATGYKVRYVRNVTDVGHLENDADEGEDKISKKARLEQLEPMEVAQYYTDRYHDAMRQLNVKLVSLNQLTIVLGILGAQITNWLIAEPIPADFSLADICASWNMQNIYELGFVLTEVNLYLLWYPVDG